ncbi:MAG: hypothetical protein AAGI07_15390 [Bacteroidota bacterium]
MKLIKLLLLFILFTNFASAQSLTSSDNLKIQYEAVEFIKELELLMNTLVSPDLSKLERDLLKRNSFQESANQIFLDNKVIVEDDIDPSYYKTGEKIKDLSIERYLSDLDLFYSKNRKKTIRFSNIKTSEVKKKNYVFLEVYFESKFTGNHLAISKAYRPTKRVATIIARKEKRSWKMLIGSIVFYDSRKHSFVYKSQQVVKNSLPTTSTTTNTEMPVPKKVSVIKDRIITVGANVGFAFGFNQASLGLHSQVYLADYLAVGAHYNYFAPVSVNGFTERRWGLDFDFNYVFERENANKIPYTILGLNILRQTQDNNNDPVPDSTDTFGGVNLGAGMEIISQRNMVYFGQVKYTSGQASHFLITAGIRFKFKIN